MHNIMYANKIVFLIKLKGLFMAHFHYRINLNV